MSTRTFTSASAPPWRKVGAAGLQIASWFTTFWAVQWLWPEGSTAAQAIAAVFVEAGLVILKEQLFRGGSRAVGWAGMVIDAIVNTGGLLPRAGRLLTFPPIALVLTMLGIRVADADVATIGGFLVALIGGTLLSVFPHLLWRD